MVPNPKGHLFRGVAGLGHAWLALMIQAHLRTNTNTVAYFVTPPGCRLPVNHYHVHHAKDICWRPWSAFGP